MDAWGFSRDIVANQGRLHSKIRMKMDPNGWGFMFEEENLIEERDLKVKSYLNPTEITINCIIVGLTQPITRWGFPLDIIVNKGKLDSNIRMKMS